MKAEFIVKTDDDQYVDLYEALVVVRRYSWSEEYVKNRFILCPVLNGLPILVRDNITTRVIHSRSWIWQQPN